MRNTRSGPDALPGRRPSWPPALATVVVSLALVASACSPGGTRGTESHDGSSRANTSSAPDVPSSIVDLMQKTSMTERARRLFLDSDPRLVGKGELQRDCRNTSSAHVLGCFLVTSECRAEGGIGPDCSKKTKIHLLDVDRADVRDLVYVSAAHETLHAAYEQIPASERRDLDRQLESALPQLDACVLAANLGAYRAKGPDEQMSELHSVLATEFARLPPALEAHYSEYFSNRQVVVQAHDRTLGYREQEICVLRTQIDQLQRNIAGLRQQLDRLKAAGNAAAHNAQVPGFNARVSLHNRLVDSHNRRVQEYNQLLGSLGSGVDVLQPRTAQPPPS